MRAEAARAAPAASRATVVDVLLVLGMWMLFATYVSHGHLVTAYDSFRDMAGTHGFLRGELGRDPTLPGLPAWYPAAQPLLSAAIVRLTGASVLAVHGTSLFWFGWLLPCAFLLLVARAFGRAAAWGSLACVFLGSMWWITHIAMPMPSIQGVVPGLLTLWAWLAARDRGWRSAVGVGVLGALAVAFHPICGGMAMGTVLLDGVFGLAFAGRDAAGATSARRVATRACLAFGIWAALSAAILWPLLGGPILNPAPREWFGPQLRDPEFALHAHAPLVLVFGLAGLVRAAASWRRSGWLAAYALVAIPGLLAGYAAVVLGWHVPYLLPHEFQWHLHLAWGIATALAVRDLAAWLAPRGRRWGLPRPLLTVGLSVIVLGPALAKLPQVSREVLVLDEPWAPIRGLADELAKRHASGQVIATEPDVAYKLAGMAGTGAILMPLGHMNPRADAESRLQALRTLLQTDDESVFRGELERTPARYLLHLPADTTQRRRLLQRHALWSTLERIPFADSAVLLYSVRDVPTREPARSP